MSDLRFDKWQFAAAQIAHAPHTVSAHYGHSLLATAITCLLSAKKNELHPIFCAA